MAFSKNFQVFSPSRPTFILLANSDGLLVADNSLALRRRPKPFEKKHIDYYQHLPWGWQEKMVAHMPSVVFATGCSSTLLLVTELRFPPDMQPILSSQPIYTRLRVENQTISKLISISHSLDHDRSMDGQMTPSEPMRLQQGMPQQRLTLFSAGFKLGRILQFLVAILQ